jgi:DNA repair exonuclease SbcCD ATPase subunit
MIETLRLKNFRRYGDQRLTFCPGVNYLLGENNAGKTTIFYAIEYVLFGSIAGFRSPAMLMRAKAHDMGVEMVFTGKEGARYRLQRMHKKPPRAKTQIQGHFTLKQIHADDDEQYVLSSDFQDHEEALTLRLSQILGVGRRLFELALHLRQSEIPAMLAGTPKLDMLLGITAAVQANSELRSAALELEKVAQDSAVIEQSLRHAEEQRDQSRQRLTQLEAEAADLNETTATLSAGYEQAAAAQRRLNESLVILGDYAQSRRALDEQRHALEHAKANLTAFMAEYGDQDTLTQVRAALESDNSADQEQQRVAMSHIQEALRGLDRQQGDIRGRIERRRSLLEGEGALCETAVNRSITRIMPRRSKPGNRN